MAMRCYECNTNISGCVDSSLRPSVSQWKLVQNTSSTNQFNIVKIEPQQQGRRSAVVVANKCDNNNSDPRRLCVRCSYVDHTPAIILRFKNIQTEYNELDLVGGSVFNYFQPKHVEVEGRITYNSKETYFSLASRPNIRFVISFMCGNVRTVWDDGCDNAKLEIKIPLRVPFESYMVSSDGRFVLEKRLSIETERMDVLEYALLYGFSSLRRIMTHMRHYAIVDDDPTHRHSVKYLIKKETTVYIEEYETERIPLRPSPASAADIFEFDMPEHTIEHDFKCASGTQIRNVIMAKETPCVVDVDAAHFLSPDDDCKNLRFAHKYDGIRMRMLVCDNATLELYNLRGELLDTLRPLACRDIEPTFPHPLNYYLSVEYISSHSAIVIIDVCIYTKFAVREWILKRIAASGGANGTLYTCNSTHAVYHHVRLYVQSFNDSYGALRATGPLPLPVDGYIISAPNRFHQVKRKIENTLDMVVVKAMRHQNSPKRRSRKITSPLENQKKHVYLKDCEENCLFIGHDLDDSILCHVENGTVAEFSLSDTSDSLTFKKRRGDKFGAMAANNLLVVEKLINMNRMRASVVPTFQQLTVDGENTNKRNVAHLNDIYQSHLEYKPSSSAAPQSSGRCKKRFVRLGDMLVEFNFCNMNGIWKKMMGYLERRRLDLAVSHLQASKISTSDNILTYFADTMTLIYFGTVIFDGCRLINDKYCLTTCFECCAKSDCSSGDSAPTVDADKLIEHIATVHAIKIVCVPCMVNGRRNFVLMTRSYDDICAHFNSGHRFDIDGDTVMSDFKLLFKGKSSTTSTKNDIKSHIEPINVSINSALRRSLSPSSVATRADILIHEVSFVTSSVVCGAAAEMTTVTIRPQTIMSIKSNVLVNGRCAAPSSNECNVYCLSAATLERVLANVVRTRAFNDSQCVVCNKLLWLGDIVQFKTFSLTNCLHQYPVCLQCIGRAQSQHVTKKVSLYDIFPQKCKECDSSIVWVATLVRTAPCSTCEVSLSMSGNIFVDARRDTINALIESHSYPSSTVLLFRKKNKKKTTSQRSKDQKGNDINHSTGSSFMLSQQCGESCATESLKSAELVVRQSIPELRRMVDSVRCVDGCLFTVIAKNATRMPFLLRLKYQLFREDCFRSLHTPECVTTLSDDLRKCINKYKFSNDEHEFIMKFLEKSIDDATDVVADTAAMSVRLTNYPNKKCIGNNHGGEDNDESQSKKPRLD